ncbi:MAG TPA: GSCFA domain-containing protein [Chitinophagaceae bacterium]|nr:GSCFA domain-containing protein [Chitinophagaceae bacterium]
MDFFVDINIPQPPVRISYKEKIMLTGSCFTAHIGNSLAELKFPVMQNPNGILFDPASVASSIVSYIQDKRYTQDDLFYLNEVWNSWQHHSVFSHVDAEQCLAGINRSQEQAHGFLKSADWTIITLGSSFSYQLTSGKGPVANCHRAPGQWFRKHLMTIEEINSALDGCLHQLWQFNRNIKVIFTVSPVRHIRDGVIENNRSKARLIEVVHHLVNKFDNIFYFPAYELVVDVLRDYRFYDIDMVHPNYAATEFVLEKFTQHYVDEASQALMQEIKKIVTARKHKPFQPETQAHKLFLRSHLEKAQALQQQHSYLDLREEIDYFAKSASSFSNNIS